MPRNVRFWASRVAAWPRAVQIATVIAAAIVLFLITDIPAAAAYDRLRGEFQDLQVPAQAVITSTSGWHEPLLARFGATFKTRFDYAALRSFYDAELARHDWSFVADRSVTDWGVDYGGRQACYQHGEDFLDLDYAGERANNGWHYYDLYLTWHRGLCGR